MSAPRRPRITFEDIGDVTVVKFTDKKILEEQAIQNIGDDLFKLVDELGRKKLLLDFTTVEFLSSAFLGKLIRLHQRLATAGGKLILSGVSKAIMEIFELTKLDKMLKIVKDEQTGLNSF